MDAANFMSSTLAGLAASLKSKSAEVDALSADINAKSKTYLDKCTKALAIQAEVKKELSEMADMYSKMKKLHDEMNQLSARMSAFEPQWMATCAQAGVAVAVRKRTREDGASSV